MTQEFIDQLLRVENTVQIDELEDKNCMICLEPYGALNSSTGSVELPVRLPCNHVAGTVCIATWLREKNSCPACRGNLFPAQPQSSLEYEGVYDFEEFMNAFMSESTRGVENRIQIGRPRLHFEQRIRNAIVSLRMGGRDETDPFEICNWLCEEFNLNGEVRDLAQSITNPMSQVLEEQVHLPECTAILSVYIALHLLNQDDSSTNFLVNLSQTSVGQDIHSLEPCLRRSDRTH